MIWPVDVNTVTQEFGAWPNPAYQPDGHTGMDFGVNVGTPVRATAAGRVLWADWAQGLGWPNPYYIAIDFDGPANGDQSAGIVVVVDHGSFASLYAHLDQTGLNPGDRVGEGEVIGQTGNTGRSSGPHLHFEILPDGWDVSARWFGRRNPRDYIGMGLAAAGTTIEQAEEDDMSDEQYKALSDKIDAAIHHAHRAAEVAQAIEDSGTRAKVDWLLDMVTDMDEANRYLKTAGDDTLYEFTGGKLRGITKPEWEAEGYPKPREVSADLIATLKKGSN